MADRVLRDHLEPCEHSGGLSGNGDAYQTGEFWFCETCPGGQEVTDAELVRLAAEAQRADPTLAAVWADVFEQEV